MLHGSLWWQILLCMPNANDLEQCLLLILVVVGGGMAIIAKGLVQAKLLAMTAYLVIAAILTAPTQTSASNAVLRLLAEMQGVRRLSNLLCPIFGEGDACGGYLLQPSVLLCVSTCPRCCSSSILLIIGCSTACYMCAFCLLVSQRI